MSKVIKRKIGEWIIAIYSAIGVIFLFAGLAASLTENELGSAEVASWVQAICSVAAIVAAIFVFNGQKDADRERDAANLKNSIRALEVEIASHTAGVEVVVASINRSMNLNEMNSFVETKVYFPIYASCASALGSVNDRKVQTAIINQYRWIEVFYDMVNRLGDIQRNQTIRPLPVADIVALQSAAVRQGRIIAESDCISVCNHYLRNFDKRDF